jgi:hypothetical protein
VSCLVAAAQLAMMAARFNGILLHGVRSRGDVAACAPVVYVS